MRKCVPWQSFLLLRRRESNLINHRNHAIIIMAIKINDSTAHVSAPDICALITSRPVANQSNLATGGVFWRVLLAEICPSRLSYAENGEIAKSAAHRQRKLIISAANRAAGVHFRPRMPHFYSIIRLCGARRFDERRLCFRADNRMAAIMKPISTRWRRANAMPCP